MYNGDFSFYNKPDENGNYLLKWEITDKGIYKSYFRTQHPDTRKQLLHRITNGKEYEEYSTEINRITGKQLKVRSTENTSHGLVDIEYFLITDKDGNELIKSMEFRSMKFDERKYEFFPETIDGEQPVKKIEMTIKPSYSSIRTHKYTQPLLICYPEKINGKYQLKYVKDANGKKFGWYRDGTEITDKSLIETSPTKHWL